MSKNSEEYERLEDLARRLAQVPKEELDELEKKEAAKKAPSDSERSDASSEQKRAPWEALLVGSGISGQVNVKYHPSRLSFPR